MTPPVSPDLPTAERPDRDEEALERRWELIHAVAAEINEWMRIHLALCRAGIGNATPEERAQQKIVDQVEYLHLSGADYTVAPKIVELFEEELVSARSETDRLRRNQERLLALCTEWTDAGAEDMAVDLVRRALGVTE